MYILGFNSSYPRFLHSLARYLYFLGWCNIDLPVNFKFSFYIFFQTILQRPIAIAIYQTSGLHFSTRSLTCHTQPNNDLLFYPLPPLLPVQLLCPIDPYKSKMVSDQLLSAIFNAHRRQHICTCIRKEH